MSLAEPTFLFCVLCASVVKVHESDRGAAVSYEAMDDRELVFVYNADSSLGAKVFDFLHKAVSPGTYECNLCRVTYGVFAEKKEWKDFIKGLPYRVAFLYKDQLAQRYPEAASTPLPAVFLKSPQGGFTLLASAEEINRARTVKDLKSLLTGKLRA